MNCVRVQTIILVVTTEVVIPAMDETGCSSHPSWDTSADDETLCTVIDPE